MSFLAENAPLLRSLLWFIGGALGYRVLASLTGYLILQSYATRINESAMALVARTSDELRFTQRIKYSLLEDVEAPISVQEAIKAKDTEDMNTWKVQVIGYFKNEYPPSYLKTVDFHEWSKILDVTPPKDANNEKKT